MLLCGVVESTCAHRQARKTCLQLVQTQSHLVCIPSSYDHNRMISEKVKREKTHNRNSHSQKKQAYTHSQKVERKRGI